MHKTPLVVHLIYRLDFGGLETLVVECINRMPADKYRHAIICLSDYSEFAKKISRPGVELYALHKPPGTAPETHVKLWKLLRRLRPAILHTYNLSAIEYAFTAALAGVPIRVHAEHGRDASDPQGMNRKHQLLRRWLTPFIDCFIPVSADLQRWLKFAVGVPDAKNLLINNGVDTDQFKPGNALAAAPWSTGDGSFVIGTVGRIQDVKNHRGLVDAFIRLREQLPAEKSRLRLTIVGDGPLFKSIEEQIAMAGLADVVWLPGARTDIAEIMRTFSVFALPSIAEGTPVTILEAMSTGLAIVATRVGGIPEVVTHGTTGLLVAPSDRTALADALASYCEQPALAHQHGAAGRVQVKLKNSTTAMVAAYTGLYDRLLESKTRPKELNKSCAG